MSQPKITVDAAKTSVRLETPALHLEVSLEYGPRIRHLSRPGKGNLLFWEQQATLGRGDWKLRGGHRIWVGRPMADEAEETYAEDNGAVTLATRADGFSVTGAQHPATGLVRGYDITVVKDQELTVRHFVENKSDMLSSGLLWPLTCTLPAAGTRYLVPLGDGSSWDTFTQVHFRKWSDHGQGHFEDPQFVMKKDVLEITPQGLETKRMFRAERGVFALVDPSRDAVFMKVAKPTALGRHPRDCNLACYIGPRNFMVEMESMGPETPMAPGARIAWDETWVLTGHRDVKDTAGLLALV